MSIKLLSVSRGEPTRMSGFHSIELNYSLFVYCFFTDAATLGSELKGKRRHVLTKKLKDFTMKPRGALDGAKRTPLHLADPWQKQNEYEVEKVGSPVPSCFVFSCLS